MTLLFNNRSNHEGRAPVIRTRLSLAAKLFAPGETPSYLRRVLESVAKRI